MFTGGRPVPGKPGLSVTDLFETDVKRIFPRHLNTEVYSLPPFLSLPLRRVASDARTLRHVDTETDHFQFQVTEVNVVVCTW